MANIQWTEREYVAASLNSSRGRIIRLAILLPVAFALISCSLFFQKHGWLSAPAGAIVGGLLFLGILLAAQVRMRAVFRGSRTMQETFHLSITGEGIDYAFASGSYNFKWDQVSRWSESRDFLFLFESEANTRMIPKRVLSPEEDSVIRGRLKAVPRK